MLEASSTYYVLEIWYHPEGGMYMTSQEYPLFYLALWLWHYTRLDRLLRRYLVHRVTELVFIAHQAHCGGRCTSPYMCRFCKEYGMIYATTPMRFCCLADLF